MRAFIQDFIGEDIAGDCVEVFVISIMTRTKCNVDYSIRACSGSVFFFCRKVEVRKEREEYGTLSVE